MSNTMLQLRSKSQGEEIDYTFVMDCLKDFKSPKSKLTTLLQKEFNPIKMLKHASC